MWDSGCANPALQMKGWRPRLSPSSRMLPSRHGELRNLLDASHIQPVVGMRQRFTGVRSLLRGTTCEPENAWAGRPVGKGCVSPPGQ